MIFVSLTSKIILLKVQSAHINFEISRSNSKQNSKFDPKFDFSGLVDSFAISDKPIEQIEKVMNVSNPELYALSSDTSLELITTTVIEIQGYLCISCFHFKTVAMVTTVGQKCGHGSKFVCLGVINVCTNFHACTPK